MARILSLVIVAAVAAVIALLPEAPMAKLASLDANELLQQELESGKTLGEAILEGPSFHPTPDPTRAEFHLGGVNLFVGSFGGSVDLIDAGLLNRSVRRGLREVADAKGIQLEIVDKRGPTDRAAVFVLAGDETHRTLTWEEARNESFVPVTVRDDWVPPTWKALLPPFIAILLAILFRQPVLALFLGILGGTFLLRQAAGSGTFSSLGGGLSDLFVKYFWENEAKDADNLYIIGFVVFMLSMVGVLTRAGGIRGLMDAIARFAGTVKSTLMSTFAMGLAVFFDDYANTILVGSTMRPLTDKLRISREKLAYVVDSTAAPVAGISIFSTWIAYEVSMFAAQLPVAGLSSSQGYSVFIETLPFRFYCILSLVMVFLIIVTGRDFGPMLKAEQRARHQGKLVREGGTPMVSDVATGLQPAEGVTPRAIVAIAPLVAFILTTLGLIFYHGGGMAVLDAGELFTIQGLATILDTGAGNARLFYGSLTGLVLACVFAASMGIAKEIPGAAWVTLRSMLIAFLILYLAWMMGKVCEDLGTATYLSVLFGDTAIYATLPAILFLLSAVVAFSTGSSWSTMAILLPLVVGLAYSLGQETEIGGHALMVMAIASVLEGSIFGDHCSPISDTTVMSSISSASDHIDHVRTQAPYAITVMLIALGVGYIPCALYGTSPWVSLGAGSAILFVLLIWGGKRPEAPVPAPE